MQTTEHLGVLPEIETREVEEGEQISMADVEEEVCRALVVAVLEQLRERELEQVLIEGDRRLDVAREESEVMESARRRRCPLTRRPEVLRPEGSPLLAAIHCGTVSGHGHLLPGVDCKPRRAQVVRRKRPHPGLCGEPACRRGIVEEGSVSL